MSALLDLARAGADGMALSAAADDRTCLLIDGFVHTAGPPPARFAWAALGSHARRELHCASDQDHALLWEDQRASTGSYAVDLAASVIVGLEEFGMRRCSGGYMADRWSYGVEEWVDLLRDMIAAPTPDAVLDTDILLDVRVLRGTLAADPLRAVLATGADSPRLLHGLASAAHSFGTGLAAFGRVPDHVDVKKGGLAPLVMLARLYGLQAGSPALGTVERLQAAAGAGVLSQALTEELIVAYDLLAGLRLRHQVQQAGRGEALSDVIDVCALERPQLLALRDALRAIKQAQTVTSVTFRTDL